MPMFPIRFWGIETRGRDKPCEERSLSSATPVATIASAVASDVATTAQPLKRRQSLVDTSTHLCFSDQPPPTKRVRLEPYNGLPSPTSAAANGEEDAKPLSEAHLNMAADRAKDAIQHQFSLEILLKHDELRLINQELSKCQIALEQLRRCHLMPYPTNCPTPDQVLNLSCGKGPALQSCSGETVPKWAPPFGVVDGPYARHYAKWLIPDPVFDGIEPDPHPLQEVNRARLSLMEGRSTRNSSSDVSGAGKRFVRGAAGQKLQALSSGNPQPKDKQSPCIVKRSDGQTVKLVCVDCHRWDFSSTQGFINHCRIAHRRDYKSHDEAAIHCGQPIETDDAGSITGQEKAAPGSASGLVHTFARSEDITDQQAFVALQARIQASMDLLEAGRHPLMRVVPIAGPSAEPAVSDHQSKQFVPSSSTPYLSRLMQTRMYQGDLSEEVNDAKTQVDFDDLLSSGEEDEDDDDAVAPDVQKHPMGVARTPVIMRVPARTDTCTTARPMAADAFPVDAIMPSTGRPDVSAALMPNAAQPRLYEDDMDVDLSPNTTTSNNAPSLVSDDGEYDDDSDDASASESSDEDTTSVSDVAEVIEDNDDTPRPIFHHKSSNTSVKFKKDEAKHVSFVSPIPNSNVKGRRIHQV